MEFGREGFTVCAMPDTSNKGTVMNSRYIILLVLFLINPARAYALDGYAGIGIGQSEINQGFFGKYGNGFKIIAGIRLHSHWAIEAAYSDYGKPQENLFGVETEYEATAVAAWAKGLWPVTRKIDLLGKVGLASWKVKKTTTLFGSPPSTTTSEGTDFSWGIGVAFNHWKSFSIQVEYEDVNADIDTMTLWSVSALYRF
jgi:opacity protein-like surface antigen